MVIVIVSMIGTIRLIVVTQTRLETMAGAGRKAARSLGAEERT